MSRIPRFLKITLGVILLIVFTVPTGRAFMRWHMGRVNQELTDLAMQLGHTPDAMLSRSTSSRDFGLGFPANEYCDARLIFATSLSLEQFTTRVHEAIPATRAGRPGVGKSFVPYDELPLIAKSISAEDSSQEAKLVLLTVYGWKTADLEDSPIFVHFYDLGHASARFEYSQRPFTQNIVELYKNGGFWPLWFNCPRETVVQ